MEASEMAEVPDVRSARRPVLQRIDLERVRSGLSAGEWEDGLARLNLMVGTILPRLIAETRAEEPDRD
jgi:hypothetical protein